MLLYHYNPFSLQYIGKSIANEDPLVPNRWVQPAHATFLAPPDDDKIYLFVNDEWVVKEEDIITNVLDQINEELPVDEWEILRAQRNELLRQTDYMFLMDYVFNDETYKEKVKQYRQALRDLPSNTEDPSNPVYPTL